MRVADSPGVKIQWSGTVTSVQPRIRLLRSYDERSHSYLGYVLRLDGDIGGEHREFLVAVGKGTHSKFQFRVGDVVSGESRSVMDGRMEPAEFYRTSKVKLLARAEVTQSEPPPWLGVAPDLAAYRERGHRRLAARTYEVKCQPCIWGCLMPVEIIVDHWNPEQRRYRFETFCYGPKSCTVYRAGPTRKVPGRRGMVWEEPDWVDEDATSHRRIGE